MVPPGRIPLPPLELRTWVGPTDPADYENPSGTPIYAGFDVPLETYEAVFDFGCGCGRVARQLLQQDPKPRSYVGIDVNNGLVEWCQENLSPVDQNFRFFHHDVYSPNYAPGNRLQLALPLPANDGEFTLVIAHSVFTHLTRTQAEYYLSEIRRILGPRGMMPNPAFQKCIVYIRVNPTSAKPFFSIASGSSRPFATWGSACGRPGFHGFRATSGTSSS